MSVRSREASAARSAWQARMPAPPAWRTAAPAPPGILSGFTLIELLVVLAVIALLMAILLPSATRARREAQAVRCAANQHQLALALHMYASEHRGRTMPLAYFDDWPVQYWWGLDTPEGIDHTRGLLWPYMQSDLRQEGVFECPSQPVGTYDQLQGSARQVSSTYGYNGYFLAPTSTPGWAYTIGHRPWQNLDTLADPARTFAFADTMISLSGRLRNCALLDPPQLYDGYGGWNDNPSPTTSFRHTAQTMAVFVDGHVGRKGLEGGRWVDLSARIGSVTRENDPYYVPDWRDW